MFFKSKIFFLILAVVFFALIIGLSFYFRASQKSVNQPSSGISQITISASKNLGNNLDPFLAQILPPDFSTKPFQTLQNTKRELSDGTSQYIFTYSSPAQTLSEAYSLYRDYLSKNATLAIDRLYKDNFLLEAKSPEKNFHFVGSLSQDKSLITLSWIELKK